MRKTLLIALVLAFFCALMAGASFVDPFSPMGFAVIKEVRLPKVVLALANGALLGASGALYQIVLRNPLADGFTTGTASSCALGAVLAISLGLPFCFVPALAVVTGALGFAFVYLISMRGGTVEPVTLILAGIVVNVVASSTISLLKFLFEGSVLSVVFWLMGGIPLIDWGKILAVLGAFLFCFLFAYRKAALLDVLSFDDYTALSLGADVVWARRAFFAVATVMVAFSVSFCGIIAFVGLIAPHIARRLFGASAGDVLLFSSVIGALILVSADALSRSLLLKGAEIPVGVLTSIMGGGFFLYLLLTRGRYGHSGF